MTRHHIRREDKRWIMRVTSCVYYQEVVEITAHNKPLLVGTYKQLSDINPNTGVTSNFSCHEHLYEG